MLRLLIVFIAALIAASVRGECPAVEDIPTMITDERTFTCAAYYTGPGAEHPINSCTQCNLESGSYWYLDDGDDYTGW